jgi:adenylate cyclase
LHRPNQESRVPHAETVAVLFADISGSTALYQRLGDTAALKLVDRCLDQLGVAATGAGGQVVRSKGDDVLCTFASVDAALRAARAMVEGCRGQEVRVRAAIAHGPVLHARDDIFGDAVNRAAHLLRLAKPNEILAAGEAHDLLDAAERMALRRLGRHELKGESSLVTVYEVLPLEETAGSTVAGGGTRTVMVRKGGGETTVLGATLRLSYRGQKVQGRFGQSVTIGRATGCDLVVPHPWVSRQHATLTVTRGKATLVDHSSTGTLVRLADGHRFTVRRESVVLAGSGELVPGGDAATGQAEPIAFDMGGAPGRLMPGE